MGHLDENQFAQMIAGCTKCDRKTFEVSSYIDRQVAVMVGEANDDGRWTHDGEKFIDGVFRIKCIHCGHTPFASPDCPRCHRENGLAEAVGVMSRIGAPKRCPSCKGMELLVSGFAPAIVRTGEGRQASPTPTALYGEPGFHVVAIMCDGCDWVQASEVCPLCAGPAPLRTRPG